MEYFKHIIDGVECESADGSTFDVVNPSTGEVYGRAAFGKKEDVDRAVASARKAFLDGRWRSMSGRDRAAILWECARLIRERAAEIAEVESKDTGKPLAVAHGEAVGAASLFEYYAGFTEEALGTVYSQPAGYFAYSAREPYGVVGAIAPWNYPFTLAAWKTIPAIVAGNSTVLKMAEQTPASSSLLASLCLEAGIPPGVLNVVHGDGPTTGAALTDHPDVPKLTFTGSTGVGRAILRAAAQDIKSVHLELGGKSANIVLDDADLDQAVAGSMFTAFTNSGQICTSGSRLLVQDSIADEFVERMAERARAMSLREATAPDAQLGPLISQEQFSRVTRYISLGRELGFPDVVGYSGAIPDRGYFVPPVIFDHVDPASRIGQEEIFGPVLSVIRFTDIEEAIEIANGVMYGLAATVWTNDIRRTFKLSEALDAGLIWVNAPHQLTWNVPYEGHRASGLGEDLGAEALRTFTQLKVTYIAHAGQQIDWA